MARLQNSSMLVGWKNESPPFILEQMYNEYYRWQNLAEEEALRRHEEETKKETK